MTDIPVRHVNDHVAIACDEHQYVVQVFRGVRKSGRRAGAEMWDAKYFCRDKFTLIALVVRAGATQNEAFAAVRDLPDTIADYHAQEDAAKRPMCESRPEMDCTVSGITAPVRARSTLLDDAATDPPDSAD